LAVRYTAIVRELEALLIAPDNADNAVFSELNTNELDISVIGAGISIIFSQPVKPAMSNILLISIIRLIRKKFLSQQIGYVTEAGTFPAIQDQTLYTK
jgi:hypothetical protein